MYATGPRHRRSRVLCALGGENSLPLSWLRRQSPLHTFHEPDGLSSTNRTLMLQAVLTTIGCRPVTMSAGSPFSVFASTRESISTPPRAAMIPPPTDVLAWPLVV